MSKRLVAILLSAALFLGPASAQTVLQIVPTTTLSAETGINTSAAPTFVSQSNGNVGAGNVSKVAIRSLLYEGNQTLVFIHTMLWFGKSNHMDVGYSSTDPAQARKMVADMKSRGADGLIFSWPGRKNTWTLAAINAMIPEMEAQGLKFYVLLEDGSLKWGACGTPCDVNAESVRNFNYIIDTFASSPAYFRTADGRPMIGDFGLETMGVDFSVVIPQVRGNPKWVKRNPNSFANSLFQGAYSWGPSQRATATYDYDASFHKEAEKYPTKYEVSGAFKGFNDTLASWSANRINPQDCAQTWLNRFKVNNDFHSVGNPLDMLQVITWNDYEEGTEIETGIDNCVSISASVAGQVLSWNVSGQENTLDHFEVFVSQDGQNLMSLASVPAVSRSLDLSQFALESGQNLTLHVKAVGKPSIVNHMTTGAAYASPLVKPSIAASALVDGTIVKVSAVASTANIGKKITAIIVYVDSVQQYKVSSDTVNVTFVMPIGIHKITTNTWDGSGLVGTATITVTSVSPATVKILQ